MKIERIFSKEIIDLESLPDKYNKKCFNLESLRHELATVHDNIKDGSYILVGGDCWHLLCSIRDVVKMVDAILQRHNMSIQKKTEKAKPSAKNNVTDKKMSVLDTKLLPPELWLTIMSNLNFQDKLSLRSTDKNINRTVDNNCTISTITNGFYIKKQIKIVEVLKHKRNADKKSTFLFFKNDNKFRKEVRVALESSLLSTTAQDNKIPSLELKK